MMAVAFGMGYADQGAKCEVLLHGKSGLTGQVLAGDEKLLPAGVPFGGAGRIEDRRVNSLAGFGGDAAIAERTRRWKRLIGVVRLVDDEVSLGNCAQWR